MRKAHRLWLEAFLKNCASTNKSIHTLTSYRSDLHKFIAWYEGNFNSTLNYANAEVISTYKNALSGCDKENSLSQEMNFIQVEDALNEDKHLIQNPRFEKKSWWKKSLEKAKNFFKRRPQKRIQILQEFLSPIEKKNNIKISALSVSSRRRHLSTIKNFYEYLKQANEDRNDLFPSNPVKGKLHSIKLKEEDVTPTQLLTRKDWEQLEKKIYRPSERLLINLLYYGGLRLTEATRLKVNQFNQEKGQVTFIRKGGYVHTLSLQNSKYLFELLNLHLRFRPHQSEFLFCNKKGKCLSSRAMYNKIVRILSKAQCPTPNLGPHSFRKACATNLYLTTKDLLVVRDYLNHSDAKITQTYIEMPTSPT